MGREMPSLTGLSRQGDALCSGCFLFQCFAMRGPLKFQRTREEEKSGPGGEIESSAGPGCACRAGGHCYKEASLSFVFTKVTTQCDTFVLSLAPKDPPLVLLWNC
jgi:hypothetical protein